MGSKKFSLVVEPLSGKSAPLYFKEDGSRFADRYTIKLRLGSEYCLRLTVTPPLSLDVMNVGLEGDDDSKSVTCKCAVTELSRDQHKAVYVTNWTPTSSSASCSGSPAPLSATGVADIMPLTPSKKNQRQNLILTFPMNLGDVKLNLQCKIYAEKSKKHQGGRRLNSVEQGFTINEQSMLEQTRFLVS